MTEYIRNLRPDRGLSRCRSERAYLWWDKITERKSNMILSAIYSAVIQQSPNWHFDKSNSAELSYWGSLRETRLKSTEKEGKSLDGKKNFSSVYPFNTSMKTIAFLQLKLNQAEIEKKGNTNQKCWQNANFFHYWYLLLCSSLWISHFAFKMRRKAHIFTYYNLHRLGGYGGETFFSYVAAKVYPLVTNCFSICILLHMF